MAKLAVVGLMVAVLLLAVWVGAGSALAPQLPAQVISRVPQGDAARGLTVFQQTSIHGTPGCVTCHSVQPGATLVGPSLAGIGTRAAALLQSPAYKGLATTPDELLRDAILTRDAGLWGGYRHLILPEWEGVFEKQELVDLTAYLASLK